MFAPGRSYRALSAADVDAVAPSPAETLRLLEDAFRALAAGQAAASLKQLLHPPGGHILSVSALLPAQGALGSKWHSYFPENDARGLPRSAGLLILNDPESGLPIAVMDSTWITTARTAGVTALAAHLLSPPSARTVGLVGTGALARALLPLLATALPGLERVRVASRHEGSRQAFCAAFAHAVPFTLTPAGSPEEAVRGADLAISATGGEPGLALDVAALAPEGLALPLEIDRAWTSRSFAEASLLVVDFLPQLQFLRQQGRFPDGVAPVVHELGGLLQGQAAGHPAALPAGRRIFLQLGTGIGDITLARAVHEEALKRGLGTVVPA
ncbi:MAG: ornithine cyclodeaminase family protein [Deltaproteobacteria bacterium]|nr:ornithine cyclodeaminase family protein [Deltaproteobacteria bacterium]MBI3077752.1 ornithine cyclodeaminase family protein [Deltaproteobacteria bacterium]